MNNVSPIIEIVKTILIAIFTYYCNYKMTNIKMSVSKKEIIKIFAIILFAMLCGSLKYKVDYLILIISLILFISIVFDRDNIGKSIITTIISISVNYIVFVASIILVFIFNKLVRNYGDNINLIIMISGHVLIIYKIFKIRKLKYGISFLKNNEKNTYIDILILNLSGIILFIVTALGNTRNKLATNMCFGFLIFSIIMFITIQKSLQLYYKQKLLVQELEQTKKDLADKTKEIEILEKENITISKRNHTIDHKQKSLELKMAEMMNKSEISQEEAAEVRERLKQISKDINKEKIATELDKTEISEIDDMLKYMQTECNKNKIEFELQIKGNIHYMTNNLISKEDLEILLADHIKNAIIAIEHTDNINKSILVRLGKIDENYGLYIYDSGIEFEQETLKNLGKIPITTHANEGGTGMGFMNTFDTLNKCKASLIIEEFNKPSKDNYTKALFIKFDNKNEFKIKSYR